MRINKKGALISLVTTGGLSYGAYEFSDSIYPLSYTLEVPIIPTLEHSEDIQPVVYFPNPETPKKEKSGAQPSPTKSENVITALPPPRQATESKDPKQEKEQNTLAAVPDSPPEVKRPVPQAVAPVVQTKVKAADTPVTISVVASAKPTTVTEPKKAPRKPVAVANPKSQEQIRKEAQEQRIQKQKSLASSAGLTVVQDYKAHNLDNYNGNPNTGVKVKTFVMGEDANYIKELWNNSIAIKHRRFWNLAPDDDPIWDQQLASAQKRIKAHADGDGNMYAYVFGSFSLNSNGRWTHLTKRSLAQRCKENLARTPWGTWWSAARARYWMLLWDFCAKPAEQSKGIPWDIDYWYRDQTGDRKNVGW